MQLHVLILMVRSWFKEIIENYGLITNSPSSITSSMGSKRRIKIVSDLYKQSAGIELELTSEDLVLSEDEAGNNQRFRRGDSRTCARGGMHLVWKVIS